MSWQPCVQVVIFMTTLYEGGHCMKVVMVVSDSDKAVGNL